MRGGGGLEFISIYFSDMLRELGGGLIQISYNAAKLNYSHEMVCTKHFFRKLLFTNPNYVKYHYLTFKENLKLTLHLTLCNVNLR